MAEDRRPIGYWLKHLDRLIEGNFERTLASEGLTRRHWQALNTLRTRPSTRAEIAAALAPFLGERLRRRAAGRYAGLRILAKD